MNENSFDKSKRGKLFYQSYPHSHSKGNWYKVNSTTYSVGYSKMMQPEIGGLNKAQQWDTLQAYSCAPTLQAYRCDLTIVPQVNSN